MPKYFHTDPCSHTPHQRVVGGGEGGGGGGGVEKDRATGGRPALPRPCRPEKSKGKKTRKMSQIGFRIHSLADGKLRRCESLDDLMYCTPCLHALPS
jgi:hypothetical protein